MPSSGVIGILPGAIGSLVMFIGIVFYFTFLYVARHDVKKYLIIDSPTHPDYDSWVRGQYGVDVEELSVLVTSIANPNQVLSGAQPLLEILGPFVYTLSTLKDNITFLDAGKRVSFNMSTTYHEQSYPTNSSGAATQIISYNSPLFSLFERMDAGRVSVLFAGGSLRAALMGDAISTVADQWLNDPSYCFTAANTFGACSLARYSADHALPSPTSLLPRINATTACLMLSVLSTPNGVLQFYDEFDSLHVTGTPRAPPTSNSLAVQWAGFLNLSSISEASFIMNYLMATAGAVADEMKNEYCASNSIFLRRHTVEEKTFHRDPFVDFLFGSDSADEPTACYLCNASKISAVVYTGQGDEEAMGMDAYESLMVRSMDGKFAQRGVKLTGRTHSLNPFIYEIPKTLALSHPFLKAAITYEYNGTVDYGWGLKARRYIFDIPDEDGSTGLPGSNTLVSRWGWHTIGPSKSSLSFTGDVALEYNRNTPLATVLAEEVSGFGVDSTFNAQYNLKLNFTQLESPPFLPAAMPYPPLLGNSSGLLVWNRTLLPSGVLYVPNVAVSLRRHCSASAAAYLYEQTSYVIRTMDKMLIIAMCVGAVLIILSISWVVWDTQGNAVFQEGGGKRPYAKHYGNKARR